jgi:hypothetical protein
MALKDAIIMQNDNGTTTTKIQIDTAVTTDTVPIVLNVNSNVGIGTTTPGTRLHIQGAVSASSYTSSLNNDVGFFGTASRAVTSSFAVSASWAPSVGGGNAFGTIAVAGQNNVVADQANDTLTLVAGTNVTITTDDATDTITINASGTGGSAFPYNGETTPAVISGSLIVSGSGTVLRITGSTSTIGSITASAGFFGTSSWASNAATASYFDGYITFPSGLDITGSLVVTGSSTVIGPFQATTKSFKIDHQRLTGKSLIYGVLEGPEHAVYARGKINIGLTGMATIQLPEEWEWLVDADSITVQLTSIGTSQIVYVKEIGNNQVMVHADTPMDCFYLIHATRKDVPVLNTVE